MLTTKTAGNQQPSTPTRGYSAFLFTNIYGAAHFFPSALKTPIVYLVLLKAYDNQYT